MNTNEVLNATKHSVKKRSESTDKQFEILRGRDGRDGVAGPQGLTGAPGPKGDAGPTGPKGETAGGIVYVRWDTTIVQKILEHS